MSRILPIRPDMQHLKNEAKALLKAHRAGDRSACGVLRHLPRLAGKDDAAVLAAEVKLAEAQYALAREYGFASWPDLRAAVPARPAADFCPDAQPEAMVLPDPPVGGTGPDRQVAALSMVLSYCGAMVDAIDVAGDSGKAFILQADALHKPYGADVQQLDIGWWPLDGWGVEIRLDFLSRAYGIGARPLPRDQAQGKADPTAHYRRYLQDPVVASLQEGRPAIDYSCGDIHVIIGIDSGEPPLLSQLSCRKELNIQRMGQYPFAVMVFGPPGQAMDRRQVDAEAIGHAVRLGRDEVDLSDRRGKYSGRSAWQLWAEQLAEADLTGPHFYHANVVGHLKPHRRAAVEYLRRLAERHSAAAGNLLSAAQTYDKVVELLDQADTGKQAFATRSGPEQLAELIDRAAQLEAEAVDSLADAAGNM